MKKIKRAIMDADSFLYTSALAGERENEFLHEKYCDFDWAKIDFDRKYKALKKKFKIKELVMVIAGDWNFRYTIYPNYKINRTQSSPKCLDKLRDYVIKKYGAIKAHGAEADDYVVWWANNHPKWVVMAIDKDIINQVTNKCYNYMKGEFEEQKTKEEVEAFPFLQTLTGDRSDNIVGLYGVGPVKAKKIYDGTWQSVVDAYKAAERTEEEALMNMRLVRLDQVDFEKKYVNLWEYLFYE